ncbi:helix-turn-helix domain-containing protein [Photorhabdus cinerea]|uniref:Transcriptional regulator n=1 Tax=Photorhabdus cinerea TaxID=471575 RepID=A0A7X5QFX8_9GAMM|nr:helix-turn-helix transcriptional regulator [Photorhabdus cinerea]NHB93748.1 transcriptional regulator [Photorhabdus cinerea]
MDRELLNLRQKLTSAQWSQIAKMSGTTTAYLNQIAHGFRRPSVSLSQRIEDATVAICPDIAVRKESLAFAPMRRVAK